jgi:hypothetical protein
MKTATDGQRKLMTPVATIPAETPAMTEQSRESPQK